MEFGPMSIVWVLVLPLTNCGILEKPFYLYFHTGFLLTDIFFENKTRFKKKKKLFSKDWSVALRVNYNQLELSA